MEKEELTNVSQQENVDDSIDYIEAIKEMKQNSVSKSDYDKVKEENRRLLQSLVNGESIQKPVEPVDVKKLRAELFGSENDYSNLDFITRALQLRDAVIEQGGVDPFLPAGKNIAPTNEDVAVANHVADVLKECVEYAEGDNLVFTNELQRRMIDTAPKRK